MDSRLRGKDGGRSGSNFSNDPKVDNTGDNTGDTTGDTANFRIQVFEIPFMSQRVLATSREFRSLSGIFFAASSRLLRPLKIPSPDSAQHLRRA